MAHEPPFRSPGVDIERSAFDGDERRAETPSSMPTTPSCPFCDRSETEIMNAFGSHASVSTYWCRPCGSPFEMMKWRTAEDGAEAPQRQGARRQE